MPDEKTQDKRLDAMIRTGLASGLDTSGAACPDPDLLAAFAENTLASDERAKWNAHFAGCAICQRQLAALARAGAIGAPLAAVATQPEVETVDAEEAREEAGGFWPAIRSAIRFLIGPFPLSVALHVALLLVLIITIHEQRGRELIMVNLEAGGGGGGGNEMQDLDMPEVPMPDSAPQQMEQPTAVDTSQAVGLASDYVRAAGGGGIGIGRGGGMGSGYGHGIGSGFGGFIGELRRKGLDVVIVIDGTGSMKLIIDDVKAKMQQLVQSIHRLVPIARIGIIVFGGKGEKMNVQPLTLSPQKLSDFLNGIQAMGGGEWEEDTLGAVQTADQQDGLEAIRQEGRRAGGRLAPAHRGLRTAARADSAVQDQQRHLQHGGRRGRRARAFRARVLAEGTSRGAAKDLAVAGFLSPNAGRVQSASHRRWRLDEVVDQGRPHQPAGPDPRVRRPMAVASLRLRPRPQQR